MEGNEGEREAEPSGGIPGGMFLWIMDQHGVGGRPSDMEPLALCSGGVPPRVHLPCPGEMEGDAVALLPVAFIVNTLLWDERGARVTPLFLYLTKYTASIYIVHEREG